MMLLVAVGSVLFAMALVLIRAALGPTPFDRILAGNAFGTKIVLLIALLAFVLGREELIDLALVYALMNFIGVIAVLRFWKLRSFADDDPEGER